MKLFWKTKIDYYYFIKLRKIFSKLSNEKRNLFLERELKNRFGVKKPSLAEIERFKNILKILFEKNIWNYYLSLEVNVDSFFEIFEKKIKEMSERNDNLNFENQVRYNPEEKEYVEDVKRELRRFNEKIMKFIFEAYFKKYKKNFLERYFKDYSKE